MRQNLTITITPEGRDLLSRVAAAVGSKPSYWIEQKAREAAKELQITNGAMAVEFPRPAATAPRTNATSE